MIGVDLKFAKLWLLTVWERWKSIAQTNCSELSLLQLWSTGRDKIEVNTNVHRGGISESDAFVHYDAFFYYRISKSRTIQPERTIY